MSAGRLTGKFAVITGASAGLGPVMEKLFVDQDAKVLLSARREDLVNEAAEAYGGDAIGIRTDVTDERDVIGMVARAVDEFGRIDVLCNNATAPGTAAFVWEQTLEDWNATIAIDVTAAMLCTREVLKQSMRERRSGVIRNLSSTAALQGHPRNTHYATAKAAMRAFTQTVANEVGGYGIRCNCIVLGGIDTDLWRGWVRRTAAEEGVEYETRRADLLSAVALRDISTPQDVANTASDDSRTITGKSIVVDAGGVMLG